MRHAFINQHPNKKGWPESMERIQTFLGLVQRHQSKTFTTRLSIISDPYLTRSVFLYSTVQCNTVSHAAQW